MSGIKEESGGKKVVFINDSENLVRYSILSLILSQWRDSTTGIA